MHCINNFEKLLDLIQASGITIVRVLFMKNNEKNLAIAAASVFLALALAIGTAIRKL